MTLADQILAAFAAKKVALADVPESDPMAQIGKKCEGLFTAGVETLRSTIPNDRMRGWLAGFFDAEGSFSAVMRFHQKTTDLFLDVTERWLHVLGFACTKTPGVEVRPLGGRWEALKLMALIQPAIMRKYAALYEGGMKCRKAIVLKLELLPEQSLIDIQTSTGTFIAAGFASHNCYQGSTNEGKAASFDSIKTVLDALADWKVFEVAIGGGEPTLHPSFVEIINHAHDLGVMPNFTTRNLSWLHGMGAMILSKVGSFAFSVDTADDVERLNDAIEPALTLRHKAAVQYVIGVDSKEQNFKKIVAAVQKYKFPLTLLGYKSTKRGATFGEKVAGRWIDVVKGAKTRIAIDTVLADKHYDELIARGVSSWLVTRKDGAFSMYVDCVEGTMHRSSYETTEATKLPMKQPWQGSKNFVVDAAAAEQAFAAWT